MSFFRQPLLHFFVLAALIFAVFSWVGADSSSERPDRIEVSGDLRASLTRQFEQTWRRPPTENELSSLVENYIDEEILVREAVLLGLDRGDAVVRQRLALKMQFLLEAGGAAQEPEDDDLREFLAANAEAYRMPPRLSFEQVVVPPSQAETAAVLAGLNAGDDPANWGASSLLPAGLSAASPRAVDSVFGDGFFAQLEQIPEGAWFGPVESGYGQHVVRVTAYMPASVPSLNDVREAVTRDWIAAETAKIAAQRMSALRARYQIVDTPEEAQR